MRSSDWRDGCSSDLVNLDRHRKCPGKGEAARHDSETFRERKAAGCKMPRSHGVSRMAMPSTILPVIEARGVPADRFPSALIRSGCRTACQPPRPRLLSADSERSCGRLRWISRPSAFRTRACQAAKIGREQCREKEWKYE